VVSRYAMATIAAESPAARRTDGLRRAAARAGMLVLVLAVLWGLWEGYRWLWMTAGWSWPFTVDSTSMPHIHDVLRALFRHPTSGFGDILLVQLLRAALFTAKEAAVGFALGASFGFVLGIALSQSKLLRRGLLPYVVASQTVPILAVAPIVVVYLGSLKVAAWFSVAVISSYLTFFPVTINTLRGLESTDVFGHARCRHPLERRELTDADPGPALDREQQRGLPAGDPERMNFPPQVAVELQENRPEPVRDGDGIGGCC